MWQSKFAHCLPPLQAYKFVPPLKDNGGNTQENQDNRKVYYGWDNVTNFEKTKLAELRDTLSQMNVVLPEYLDERELIKFLQSF
jgi:hypothetical protein